MGSYMYRFRHVACTTLSFLTLLAVSAGGATFFAVVRVHSRCQLSMSGTRVLWKCCVSVCMKVCMSHCGQTLPAIFAVLVQIMSSDPFADSASGASLCTSARLQSVCTDSVPVLQMGSYMYWFRHVVCTTLSFLTLLAVSAGGAKQIRMRRS